VLVDSHCHLDCIDLTEHDNSLDCLLEKAQANDVSHLLCVCIELENLQNIVDIAEKYPNISISVGVHPNTELKQEPTVEILVELSKHPKCIAIGETGLDYYRNQGDMTWQQDRFATHIAAAIEVQKPLIIHTRSAAEDTLTMMKAHQADSIGGVMHCFAEDWSVAKRALDLGFYISLSGIVTFKSAKTLQEVAKKVPLDRLLIETDSPYLAPVPYRGKQNHPALVKHVALFLADLLEMDYEEIAAITTENFNRLFFK